MQKNMHRVIQWLVIFFILAFLGKNPVVLAQFVGHYPNEFVVMMLKFGLLHTL